MKGKLLLHKAKASSLRFDARVDALNDLHKIVEDFKERVRGSQLRFRPKATNKSNSAWYLTAEPATQVASSISCLWLPQIGSIGTRTNAPSPTMLPSREPS